MEFKANITSIDNHFEPKESPRYPLDYEYAKLLISGDKDAWNRFYNHLVPKLQSYIHEKYPDVFGDADIEEIIDAVFQRIAGKDFQFKSLRTYRGETTFSRWVSQQAVWATQQWLREHADSYFMTKKGDTFPENNGDTQQNKSDIAGSVESGKVDENIPEMLNNLSDELRWAFLLRYYDDFGFPANEIILLSEVKQIPVNVIIEKIVKYLEPKAIGKDILAVQRKKQQYFYDKLQSIRTQILNLRSRQEAIEAHERQYNDAVEKKNGFSQQKLDRIDNTLNKLINRRKRLFERYRKVVVTTPYDVIAGILDDNISTIRSRVFQAKKILAEQSKKGKKDICE